MIKAILKYVAIFGLIVIGIFSVTVGVMFISNKANPDKTMQVFGYSLYSFNDNRETVLAQYENADFNSIEINVKSVTVTVSGTANNAMHVDIYNKMWGLAKVQDNQNYGFSHAVEEGVLKLTVNQPNGLFLNQNARLELSIPKNYSSKNITVNGVNSTVNIGNADNAYLNVASIAVNVKNAPVNIYKTKTVIQNLEINAKNNKTTVKANVLNATAKVKNAKLNVNTVQALTVNAKNITVSANTVASANITAGSAKFTVNKTANEVVINGNVKSTINQLLGSYTDTNRKTASLKILNVTGNVTTSCTKGSTELKQIAGTINVKSTKGKVVADFVTMLGENVISTTKGKVYVTAVPQQFLLNVSGSAQKTVRVTVAEVVDETTTKEAIENKAILEAPAECVNVLKINTTKGNVNINVK